MRELETYSELDVLPDGRPVTIRALRAEDEAELVDAIEHASKESLYRRFFAVRRHFSAEEMDVFFHIDFTTNVVLLAVLDVAGGKIIAGGARYVITGPGSAELAFSVRDEYQGKGIGTILMRHIVRAARRAGLKTLIAEVLPENLPMLKVFEQSGLPLDIARESDVVHLTFHLE